MLAKIGKEPRSDPFGRVLLWLRPDSGPCHRQAILASGRDQRRRPPIGNGMPTLADAVKELRCLVGPD